jgi:acetyl esterase/lipase
MDMSEGGDSFQVLRGVDPVLSNGTARQKGIYIGDADVDDHLLSPFRGDFSKGFPPSFVQAGTRDLLLSSAVLFHRALRRADVPAELHVFEAMPHGGFGGTPEDMELTLEIRKFIAKAWDV